MLRLVRHPATGTGPSGGCRALDDRRRCCADRSRTAAFGGLALADVPRFDGRTRAERRRQAPRAGTEPPGATERRRLDHVDRIRCDGHGLCAELAARADRARRLRAIRSSAPEAVPSEPRRGPRVVAAVAVRPVLAVGARRPPPRRPGPSAEAGRIPASSRLTRPSTPGSGHPFHGGDPIRGRRCRTPRSRGSRAARTPGGPSRRPGGRPSGSRLPAPSRRAASVTARPTPRPRAAGTVATLKTPRTSPARTPSDGADRLAVEPGEEASAAGSPRRSRARRTPRSRAGGPAARPKPSTTHPADLAERRLVGHPLDGDAAPGCLVGERRRARWPSPGPPPRRGGSRAGRVARPGRAGPSRVPPTS